MSVGLSVEDRLDLIDLAHRYAALVDDRDPTGVAGLFVPDGVMLAPDPPRELTPVIEHVGHDGIVQALAALDALEATVHAVAGVVLDPGSEPGTATGRVTGFAHHVVRHDGALRDVTWAVRYRDGYRRTVQGWRFTRRAVDVTFLASHPVRAVRTPAGAPAEYR